MRRRIRPVTVITNACKVCGAESVAWARVRPDDPRLLRLPKNQRKKQFVDTFCYEHLPVSMWTRRRKAVWLIRSAVNHPIQMGQMIWSQWKTRHERAVQRMIERPEVNHVTRRMAEKVAAAHSQEVAS